VTTDLGRWLDDEVTPALFERLDHAFPEFGWRKQGANWIATKWPGDFPIAAQHQSPDRLMVYANRPYWVKCHGHAGVRFLDLVHGGVKPRGEDFIRALGDLCARAGVDPAPLERELSGEQRARIERRELRRSALDVALTHCREILWSEAGRAARAYLAGRGLSDDDIRELGLGLYGSPRAIERALFEAKIPTDVVRDSALTWAKLEGYITVPWHDARGYPLTLYGRWHAKEPPDGTPKTIALPGEGTKASPLFFDRVRRAGHDEAVLVEGLFDAAILQLRGETRACATVAAQLSGLQVETLARYGIKRVFVCGDPDGGGDQGTDANVESAERIGALSFVVPRLPEGVDPDEFVVGEGIAAWKARVDGSVPGRVWQAARALGKVTPESGAPVQQAALDAVARVFTKARALDQEAIVRLAAERTGHTAESVAAELSSRRRGVNGVSGHAEAGPGPDENDAQEEPEPPDEREPYSVHRERQAAREREAVGEARNAEWRARIAPIEREWFTEPPPARKWLLRDKRRPGFDGVLPLGKAGDIIAAGGGFKTSIGLQLAVAIATGTDWLDTFSVATPGRVLLVLGEEDAAEVRRRLYQATRGVDRIPKEGEIVTLALAGKACAMLERDAKGNPQETHFLRWLRDYIASSPWALIVLDPLSRFAGPDAETDNAQGTRFVEVVESFCEASRGGTALCNHHTNKLARNGKGLVDATGGRGVTSIGDGFRWEASLTVERFKFGEPEEQERLGKIVTLAQTKTNYSLDFDPLALRRNQDGRLVPLVADDVEAVERAKQEAVLRTPKAEARKTESTTKEGAQDEAVMRAVTECPGITWRELCVRVAALGGCGDFSARKAIERTADRTETRPGPKAAALYYKRGQAPT
jgi:RecA-family ATPase